VNDRRRPNHYNTLGVHPRATAEEIRAAYRRAARDAHPDRHGDASSAQMATVNEAWSVLGDPARRHRYDQELSLTDRETIGSAVGSDAGSGAGDGASMPLVERRMPAQVLTPTGDLSRFPWKFFAVIGGLAIIVVLIGSLLGDEPPPVVPDNFLVQGDCVTIDLGGTKLTEVACTDTYDAKVQTVMNFGEVCPTGTEQFPDPMGRGEACVLRVPT
jgi:hypothetical protein